MDSRLGCTVHRTVLESTVDCRTYVLYERRRKVKVIHIITSRTSTTDQQRDTLPKNHCCHTHPTNTHTHSHNKRKITMAKQKQVPAVRGQDNDSEEEPDNHNHHLNSTQQTHTSQRRRRSKRKATVLQSLRHDYSYPSLASSHLLSTHHSHPSSRPHNHAFFAARRVSPRHVSHKTHDQKLFGHDFGILPSD